LNVRADARAVDAFVRRRVRSVIVTSAFTLVPAAALLVFDYRLMLVAIGLASLPLFVALDAIRVRRAVGAGGAIALSLEREAAIVLDRARVAFSPRDVVVRVTRDMIALAVPNERKRHRLWIVPATGEEAKRAGEALRELGARVSFERGGVARIGAVLGVALADLVLGAVAAGLVVGALANVALAVMHRGGSYGLGAALVGGALAALTLAAVLKLLVGLEKRD